MTLSAEVRAALADPPEGVTVTITDDVPFPGMVEVRTEDDERWPRSWLWSQARLNDFSLHRFDDAIVVLGPVVRREPIHEGQTALEVEGA